MQYMLIICHDHAFKPPNTVEPEVTAWVQEMKRRGMRIAGDRLRPASNAITVRVRNSELTRTDGPYADTKDRMAGFEIIECVDLDEAVEAAAQHPMAKLGSIEVRPVWK